MSLTPNLLDGVQKDLELDGNCSKRHPVRGLGQSRSSGIFGRSWRCERGYIADVFKEKFMQNHLEAGDATGAGSGGDFRGRKTGSQSQSCNENDPEA